MPSMMPMIATLLRPALNNPVIRRTRRNHAYEHATIHMLNRQRYTLSGNSNAGGFMLIGDVPTEKVETAAKEALRRLRAGENQLALHPNCGTNLVTTGLLTTSIAALGFTGTNRRSAWERFPIIMLLMMFAALYSQPLGMTLQKYITTEGDPGDLEYVSVTRRETSLSVVGKFVIHEVKTSRG
jgi:hypothetical protein